MIIMGENSIIQKKSLAEEVAKHLQSQITEGKLKEGEKLSTEPELMKKFGVGRSTIREAVKMLVNMGLLKVQQGRGTFVQKQILLNEPFEQRLKRADIQELHEVRKILEAAIAERAAKRCTEEDLKEIQEYILQRKLFAETNQLEKCIEADINFHVAIAKATHNEILFEIYKNASIHLQKGYQLIYEDTSHFVSSQALHEELVKCLMTGNYQKALEIGTQFWSDIDFIK